MREESFMIYCLKGLLALMILTFCQVSHANDEILNKVVAIVNDDIITTEEVMAVEQQLKGQPANHSLSAKALRNKATHKAVDDLLQIQVAKRINLTIDDAKVNKTIAGIAKRNKMTIAQFKEAVEKENQSFDEFKSNIKNQLRIREVRQRYVAPKIAVTDEQAKKLLASPASPLKRTQQYHVVDYLVAVDEDSEFAHVRKAKLTANALQKALKQHDKKQLAKLAFDKSDMGWRHLDKLPDLFAKPMRSAKVGSVIGPIQAGNGFHVLLVRAIKKEGKPVTTRQVRLRQLLMTPTSKRDSKATNKTLTEIREGIRHGYKFQDYVSKFSDDPVSKRLQGDIGWKDVAKLPPQFKKAIANLKPGMVSEVFETDRGWHLLMLTKYRNKDISSMRNLDIAKQHIFEQKFDAALEDWMKKVREAAYIKILS